MEEHRPYDWIEDRHFDFHGVYLESGALKLESEEVLSGPLGEASTISASLQFHLAEQPGPISEIQYWPMIGNDDSSISPFITLDIFATSVRFEELVRNVRHGLVPESISIKLSDDMRFWRVDDPTVSWSNRTWLNEIDSSRGCSAIPIDKYAFSYAIKNERIK
jgi:hypothetical protein